MRCGPSSLLFHSKIRSKSQIRGRWECIPFQKILNATGRKSFNLKYETIVSFQNQCRFKQKPYLLVVMRPFRIPQWVKQEGLLAFPDPIASIERVFSRYILFSRNENVSIFQLLIKSITFFRLDSRLLGASLHLSAGYRMATSAVRAVHVILKYLNIKGTLVDSFKLL